MKSSLTENDRRVLTLCRRVECTFTDADEERIARALSKRSPALLTARPKSIVVSGVGSILWMFKLTPAGQNVLDGKPPKAETKGEARQRKWATGTARDRKAGRLCQYPGCTDRATDGHHKIARRAGDDSEENRVPLCRKHHKVVERERAAARKLGLSASALGKITPSPDALPSRWSGGAS